MKGENLTTKAHKVCICVISLPIPFANIFKTWRWDSERHLCGKVKIKEATTLLYLDFLLRFGQVWTHLNGFFIFTHTSNPKLDIGSGSYRHPNFWPDLGPIHPGSGLNLSSGPDYGSTIDNCQYVVLHAYNGFAGSESPERKCDRFVLFTIHLQKNCTMTLSASCLSTSKHWCPYLSH